MTSPRSVRFNLEVLRRLESYVRSHPGASISSVVTMFVDEALRMEEHPGIVFRPGPTGRRAGLAGGLDVWEVVETLLNLREAEPGLADDDLVTAVAEATGLPERKVWIAVRYYAAYRNEIDERISANRLAADEAEAAARVERELLRRENRAS